MRYEHTSYWKRPGGIRRFSRRRALQAGGTLGAGAAGFALVGCGNDDDDAAAQPTPADDSDDAQPAPDDDPSDVQTGGQFRWVMNDNPRSLDFHFDTFPWNTWITTNTNEGLLRFNRDLSEIEPELAESLPENPDELTWVFTLRPGVTWQDIAPVNGREFTAEDAVYSLERQMTDDPGTYQHAYFFLGHVESWEATDERTIVATTSEPYAPMLSYIASPWTLMANREAVEEYGDLTEHAVGTGPFILESWQEDIGAEFTRNPNYWDEDENGNQLPYIDGFSLAVAPNQDTRATQFSDGQLDAVLLGEATFERTQDARPDANYDFWPSQFWRQFRMQPTTEDQPYRAPFDDIRVRQAIVQACDAQELLDLVYNGDGILTYGPILPMYEQWALQEHVPGSEFDLSAANALLEEAGNPTIEGDLIWAATDPEVDLLAEMHQAHLAEIGANISLSPMELASYYNVTYEYDYTFSSHTPLNNPDPDENLAAYFGRNATFFRHYNPEIWDMIDAQARELDIDARTELVRECQEAIVLDFPMAFLYTTHVHGFTGSRVRGWFHSQDLYNGRIRDLWLEDA